MKNTELKPPTTICPNCFEAKREAIKGSVWGYCDHNKAGAYIPYHSEPSEKIWVAISPMTTEMFALWKDSFAVGLLGETKEEHKKYHTTSSHD